MPTRTGSIARAPSPKLRSGIALVALVVLVVLVVMPAACGIARDQAWRPPGDLVEISRGRNVISAAPAVS
jgi:hypothetical protein